MRSKSSTNFVSSPNRFVQWVGRASVRLILFFICVIVVTGTASAARERAHVNARVDGLSARALVTQPAAALVDPTSQHAASVISGYQRSLFFVWLLAQTLALGWLWQSGQAARLRDVLKRVTRAALVLRFCFGAALASIAMIAGLPLRFIAYRLAFATNLDTRSFGMWLVNELVAGAVVAIAAGLGVAVVFAFVDRTRLWYLLGVPFVFAVVGLVALAEPSIDHLVTPVSAVDPPVIQRDLRTFAASLGMTPPRVVVARNGSGRDDRLDIEGIGPTTQVVIGARMLKASTGSELRFALARAQSLVALGEHTKMIVMWTLLFVTGLVIAVTISDRIGFRRDDDPLSRLALVGGLLGLSAFAVYPLGLTYDRSLESQADRTAMALTHDPAGAVRSLVRSADDRYLQVCPAPFDRWYFLRQPPIADRVHAISGAPSDCG